MKTIFIFFLIITLTYSESQIPRINTTASTKTSPKQINKELLAEGGVSKNELPEKQMKGREGFTRVPIKTTPKSAITPFIELPHSAKLLETVTNLTTNGDHKTIGRKGVGDEKTNVTIKPKKPRITVSKDEWFAPSHFELGKSNTTSSKLPQVPNVDILNNNQDNTQKYIVPIVVVILSVPFVAILISIVYKRGSEWWKYRHYRRMDFLINGIYDN